MSSSFFLLGATSSVREKLRPPCASSVGYGEGGVVSPTLMVDLYISPFSSVCCCYCDCYGCLASHILNSFIRCICILERLDLFGESTLSL